MEAMKSDAPLVETIRAVAERGGAVLDVAFVDALSEVLADFVERGIVLGSRA
jgi:hypothetical protein